jgi:hypothetical protein
VQMIRQDDHGVNMERVDVANIAKRRAQHIDMFNELSTSPVQQIGGKEIGRFRNLCGLMWRGRG